MKNFGFVDEVTVVAPGINGKMSEINAAFGLLQLKHIDAALSQRERIGARYRAQLAQVPGIRCANARRAQVANYAYFPILVLPNCYRTRRSCSSELRENDIFARRYFYPLISDFPMYRSMPLSAPSNLPVATTANQVICLPHLSDAGGTRKSMPLQADLPPVAHRDRRCDSMRVAIMQPYFLSYLGYFQLVAAADLLIVYDNIKYSKKGWINRNRMLLNEEAVTFSLPLKNAWTAWT